MALWQLIHSNIYIFKISCLVEEQIRLNKLNQKHGPSSWLASLSLAEEGYDLIKQLFWGLVRIGYDFSLTRLPAYCERSGIFDLQYALPGEKGVFVSLQHNLVRNITSSHSRTLEIRNNYSR